MSNRCELHLIRDWDTAWTEVVRPWLGGGAGLRRDYVIVPTRGQAHGLKLRCVRENLPLLGVEFLTPALARQKWRALPTPSAKAFRPAMGRELLLLNLRAAIEQHLAVLTPDDAEWGWWKSLQSDPEGALDGFDELLQAGFVAGDFPAQSLATVFGAIAARADEFGYDLAPQQEIAAGLAIPPPDAALLGGRLLLHGFSAGNWPDFFALAAIARRGGDVVVSVPEPELRGRRAADEQWVEVWSALLGVEPRPASLPQQESKGTAVVGLWTGESPLPGESAAAAKLLVGRTRADEMHLVANEVVRLLNDAAENIAVVFPRADAAHRRLIGLLTARGVPFNDLLEAVGSPPVEARVQRRYLEFQERGARIEELLALWPLLRALGFTELPPAQARDVCERVFDERQTHALEVLHERIAAGDRPEWTEVARVVAQLLPRWPATLTLAEGLERFEKTCVRFNLPLPETWPALSAYARHDGRELPLRVVLSVLASFLPEKSPMTNAPGRGKFAPVTLTTARRAAALTWSHVIFAESNAGVWPAKFEPNCWLTDEQRRQLNERGRFSLGLFTSDDRAALEKQLLCGVAANAQKQVVLSAALFEEENPELMLAPNAWMERVLLREKAGVADTDWEKRFAELARQAPPEEVADDPSAEAWREIWRRRRDPARPFDEYFLSGDPAETRPARLAARLIERGAADPAELWFGAVLGVARVEWRPFVRARKRALGSLAHRLLARAMRGTTAGGRFFRRPEAGAARANLAEAVTEWRAMWPDDRYWDSFHAELAETAGSLLDKLLALGDAPWVAVEAALPRGTKIPLGGDATAEVAGRMDVVLSARPDWSGADVDIVDFKTGADAALTAAAMARGASLQLGVYLAALKALGAADGRVWMIKPGGAKPGCVTMSELAEALTPLAQLGRHLASGRYGALTPDRTDFSRGFAWPIACTPIPAGVLREKFAATFGLPAQAVEEEAGDE